MSILIYGSEIWGYGGLSFIQKVYTDFMKYTSNVKMVTQHVMLYGALGPFPLPLKRKKKRIIIFLV